jgi:hypothetical protein
MQLGASSSGIWLCSRPKPGMQAGHCSSKAPLFHRQRCYTGSTGAHLLRSRLGATIRGPAGRVHRLLLIDSIQRCQPAPGCHLHTDGISGHMHQPAPATKGSCSVGQDCIAALPSGRRLWLPLAEGGSYTPTNMLGARLAQSSCNQQRRASATYRQAPGKPPGLG